ncbi:hypothetical protein GIB67_019701 [Kingdonia uniflora]|uniref:Uncharacterized protein n=1 Tax=Kingdonia uniflora TaxID=39325 RepID=A0A7J7MJT2_9MAGN|nr:hypothetical protein GIB67_019701 [Kingdonia uniflora]
MDTKSPEKEASDELARESLIAISQSQPDKVLAPILLLSENGNGAANLNKVDEGDGTEKYSSELISISYPQSPDTKILPAALGKLET